MKSTRLHFYAPLRVVALFAVWWFSGSRATISLAAGEKTVVLTNGSVLQGEVTQLAGEVIVRTPHSQILVAKTDVEMVASNLSAAYRQKARHVDDDNTEGRCQLIRWCLRHGLKEEAIAEIGNLQKQNPRHPQLDILRRQVRSFRSSWQQTALPHPAPPHPDHGFAEKMSHQISAATLADFTCAVQPILLNRCGQANCHGPAATNSYQLTRSPWSTVPRGITQRNLGASLRKIDTVPATQTVLWMSANSPHGSLSNRPLEEPHLRALLAWIEKASAEISGQELRGDQKVQPAVFQTSDAQDEVVDPFDPAAFNRQLAGSQDHAVQAED